MNQTLTKQIIFAFCALPLITFAQYEFNNMGADVYIQKGGLIHVQGNFINDNNTTNGAVKNDGIIEVKGNFENKTNATFQIHTDNTSTDRAVKLVGSGTQLIKGSIGTSGTASFYNLIIDKAAASDTVEMQVDAVVDGSLVFATSTTTTTYNPSSLYTNNNLKGLLKTYASSGEYVLKITNGNTNSIAGYPALAIGGAPSTGYILTKGSRGSSAGGLQRKISSASGYVYPIGTVANGFNGVNMNFTSVPNSTGSIIGKFNDGSDNPAGYVGSISQQCPSCTGGNLPDNDGYNRYFSSNSCNSNQPQWLVLQNSIRNHGYWSFASIENNNNYLYTIETFPNSYSTQGNSNDLSRVLRYDASFGYNPTTDTWNPYIETVQAISDLIQYTRNSGTCFTGNGVPGGVYSAFGHFSMSTARSNDALPVEMLGLNAEAVQTYIEVTWATALEINNMGFHVERSTDGQNWVTIGWVDGNNNSTSQSDYSYNDINVLPNIRYYYRLKQQDNDGAFEYTDIVSAAIAGDKSINSVDFFPNPAKDKTTLIITSANEQKLIIDIYDVLGRKVLSDTRQLNKGVNNIDFDTRNLASGTYTAIVSGNETYTKKLVVAK